jgi:FtsH-binding integral membrane protein
MIYKRESYINPLATVNLWVIPTFTYLLLKYVAQATFSHEWVWWIVIPFMFTVWFFINFKIGKKPKPVITFDHDEVFNVERFNQWWNNEANGATYAHSGIYLRLDKLSLSHVTEYLYKAHGLSLSEHYTYDEANDFYVEIRSNWYEQLHSM